MTRHGIGTTPNITKPCRKCNALGPLSTCPDCNGTGEIVVMKGGTPRIEDGAEVGGELSPEGVGHPPTADLSAEQEEDSWGPDAPIQTPPRRIVGRFRGRFMPDPAEQKKPELARAVERFLAAGDEHGAWTRGEIEALRETLETVSGQGE